VPEFAEPPNRRPDDSIDVFRNGSTFGSPLQRSKRRSMKIKFLKKTFENSRDVPAGTETDGFFSTKTTVLGSAHLRMRTRRRPTQTTGRRPVRRPFWPLRRPTRTLRRPAWSPHPAPSSRPGSAPSPASLCPAPLPRRCHFSSGTSPGSGFPSKNTKTRSQMYYWRQIALELR